MRKYILTAALVAVGLPLTPAMANPTNGYTVRSTVMRAGPDRDYPVVQRIRPNSGVTVYGCLRNWSWCDVSNRYDRGWVSGRDIEVAYQGRRRGIDAAIGIGILSFVFGSYWDSHYRGRPFYAERPRWERQYNNNYRPEWGTRLQAPYVAPHRPGPGVGTQPRMMTPAAPYQSQPRMQPSQPRIIPRQNNQIQRQVSPPRVQQPSQQAAPNNGNNGRSQAPGQQRKGGQQGNPHDQSNKAHKPQD